MEQIFNRKLLKLRRNRIASKINLHDFLIKIIAEDICNRLNDFNREFSTALDLGCRTGQLSDLLQKNCRQQIHTLIQMDYAFAMVKTIVNNRLKLVGDQELLPFANNIFDLIVSLFDLHFINDLTGSLIQINHSLKSNGLFIATIFGGKTLYELRQVLLEAEILNNKGVSPHVIPFADIRDIGALMQRAKFELPVVDSNKIIITYTDIIQLMHDLRYMGETNILFNTRVNYLGKKILLKADEIYKNKFSDAEGIQATFEVITMTGLRSK